MKIVVTPYSPAWDAAYKAEAEKIKNILGEECTAIHHIGSTAVPGLAAKPIIDIMPVVRDISKVDALNPSFEKIGYECMGEFGIPGRRYFRKGGESRTHQVHIFEAGNTRDIQRHLAVREYLRKHPDTARQYGELKTLFAQKFPSDIEGYCNGKDAFMKELEKLALQWADRPSP